MSQIYMNRRRTEAPARQAAQPTRQGPSMDALRSGAAAPTRELLGSRVDLPGAIQAKMESAFGADLSGVQLYESQAVADAGAEAITQGNKIGFAPGKLDFVSHQGQALLGHELSHVVSQARGEVSGYGFLNDRALESRADREGAMAAAGEQVYSGPVTGSLSDVSAAPAAGPMQAKKPPKISEPELVEGPVGKFSNSRNAAIGEMVQNASPEQMQDPHLQDLVLGSLNSSMSATLQQFNNSPKSATYSPGWRGNSGELTAYNSMLRGLATPHLGTLEDMSRSGASVEAGITATRDMVANDPHLSRMIAGAKGSFDGSVHYADEQDQSEQLMHNFMLRIASQHLSTKASDQGDSTMSDFSKGLTLAATYNMQGAKAKPGSEQYENMPEARAYLSLGKDLWGQQAAPAAQAPQKESLAAKRSRMRRKFFSK